jgi:hypothetical protein
MSVHRWITRNHLTPADCAQQSIWPPLAPIVTASKNVQPKIISEDPHGKARRFRGKMVIVVSHLASDFPSSNHFRFARR